MKAYFYFPRQLIFRACLLAAIQIDTGSAQSTIKLVATNFIANGKIWEGKKSRFDYFVIILVLFPTCVLILDRN